MPRGRLVACEGAQDRVRGCAIERERAGVKTARTPSRLRYALHRMEQDVRVQSAPDVAVQPLAQDSEAEPATRFTNQGAVPPVQEVESVHPVQAAASARAYGREQATDAVLTAQVERTVDGVTIIAPIGAHASAIGRAAEIVHLQLGANRFAQRRLAEARTTIVIIPARTRMTEVAHFASLRGQKTFDGRDWSGVRGSGGVRAPDGSFAIGVAEETLIGVRGVVSNYPTGYSIAMHELAHAIESKGLTDEQEVRLEALFRQQQTQDRRDPATHHDAFTDNYAASNKQEYFAQSSNAFFGRNVGGQRRLPNHNGRQWLIQNDPDMYAFLVDVYENRRNSEGALGQ